MIEQISTAITFYAYYSESKVGKTGLTVTIDIWEDDGSPSEIITAGAATEIGDGLYYYTLASGSVDAEGAYIAVFKTATTTVDQQHVPAIWLIQKGGVENLNATVSSRASQTSLDTLDDLVDTEIAAIQADTDNIQTRLPAALVSGRMDASVGAVATGAITADAIAADAIGASELAADAATEIAAAVWDRDATSSQTQGTFGQAIGDPVADTGTLYKAVVTDATGATVGIDVVALKAETVTILADTDNLQTRIPAALVSGRIDASVGAMAADVVTAAAIATDAIGAAELAADAVTEIAAAIPSAAVNAAAVWDMDATAHQTQGTFGQAIGDPAADTGTLFKAVVTDATGATVGIDVVALKAETVSIQADTDNIQTRLPTTLVSGRIDASVGAMAADVVTASAIATDAIGASEFAQGAADKVWSTTARTLSAAGVQAIWDALTSALTTVGSIGKMLVTNLSLTGSGSTAFTYTLTAASGGAAISGASIFITTDAAGATKVAEGTTNTSGVFVAWLNAGTYYVWRQKLGWTFTNPDTEVHV